MATTADVPGEAKVALPFSLPASGQAQGLSLGLSIDECKRVETALMGIFYVKVREPEFSKKMVQWRHLRIV